MGCGAVWGRFMRTVSFTEARRDLSALLREVESGGEIVITRGGRPVARLVAGAVGMEALRAQLAALPPVEVGENAADAVRAAREDRDDVLSGRTWK